MADLRDAGLMRDSARPRVSQEPARFTAPPRFQMWNSVMKLIVAAALALFAVSPALAHDSMDHSEHAAAPVNTAEGVGVIRAIDLKAGVVTLKHEPIAALKWPAMTMRFEAPPAQLAPLKVGQAVKFTLKPTKGGGQITAIAPR